MLKKIKLENFRCFQKTEVNLKDLAIIVGKNNAGKSTFIEALRILSLVVNRRKNTLYVNAPDWLDFPNDTLGIQPSIKNLDISKQNVFYMYGDPPAKIIATFNSGVMVTIYIGDDVEVFATIQTDDGKFVESRKWAGNISMDELNILPQISPLLRIEPIIRHETVIKNLNTHIESRNFRNQLNYFPKAFDRFKELAERTWNGLSIDSNPNSIRTRGDLFVYVRDNNFEAEIGWMGHGLQMWLQIMWFLSKANHDSTIILDEPDVYMHADLQRRLIKLVKDTYKQVIIATHSIEIMAEVEPDYILPIDSSKARQEYATNAPLVQRIVDEIGSVHNIEIARLFSYNKFLIVEGEKDDVRLLSIFQSKLFPETFEQFDILPKTYVEGWGGWQKVLGSHKVFKENQTSVMVYCIFDSDYHPKKAIDERISDATKQGINLHIWSKKEIENYVIVPQAIYRFIQKNRPDPNLTVAHIENVIDNICESLKIDLIDCFATEIGKDRSKVTATVNQQARKYVNERWQTEKLDMLSGKAVIAGICAWIAENHKLSASKFKIAHELLLSEIDLEVVNLIHNIENRKAI